MTTNSHLAESAVSLLESSVHEKLDFLLQDQRIEYPAMDLILRDLQDVVNHPPRLKPACRAVIGDSDNGKTTLIRCFLRRNPIVLDETDRPVAKVLSVETPPTADEGRLFSAILGSYGILHRADAAPERLEALVHHEMITQQTSVLVLDEFHAMLNSPARDQKRFMASLKRLSNMRQLNIIATGTPEVARALAIDPQFVTRFTRLALPKWVGNEDFLKLLMAFESLIPLPKPSNLANPNMAQLIFKVCGGTIGGVRKVTCKAAEMAIKAGDSQITFATLQKACDWQKSTILGGSLEMLA